MPIIHAAVPEDVEAYIERWADAINATPEDVAGDAITAYVSDDVASVPDMVDVSPPDAADRFPADTVGRPDGANTLSDYVEKVPPSWCVTLRIPPDPDAARRLFDMHPIFATAVVTVARLGVGQPDKARDEDIDAVLERDAGMMHRVPIELLTGVGEDPADTAQKLTDELRSAKEGTY